MINLDETADLGSARSVMLHQATRLEILAYRLRRVAAGEAPTAAEMQPARHLDGWQLSRREVPVLMTGDADGPSMVTPDVVVLAPVSGWALSSCGWLVLGERKDMEYRLTFTDDALGTEAGRMADGAREI